MTTKKKKVEAEVASGGQMMNLKNFMDNDGSSINKYTKAYLEAEARKIKNDGNVLAMDHSAEEWWKIIKEDMKLKV